MSLDPSLRSAAALCIIEMSLTRAAWDTRREISARPKPLKPCSRSHHARVILADALHSHLPHGLMPARLMSQYCHCTLQNLGCSTCVLLRERVMDGCDELVDLARICTQELRRVTRKDVAAELWRMALNFQSMAVQLSGGDLHDIIDDERAVRPPRVCVD